MRTGGRGGGAPDASSERDGRRTAEEEDKEEEEEEEDVDEETLGGGGEEKGEKKAEAEEEGPGNAKRRMTRGPEKPKYVIGVRELMQVFGNEMFRNILTTSTSAATKKTDEGEMESCEEGGGGAGISSDASAPEIAEARDDKL